MNIAISEPDMTPNEVIIATIAKIATSSINRLSSDKEDILYSPKNISELEANTSMLNNIVAIKLKNTLIKN